MVGCELRSRLRALASVAVMGVLAWCCMAPACGGNSGSNGALCPGALLCPSLDCCPAGFPYECNHTCYAGSPPPSQCSGPVTMCSGQETNGGSSGAGNGMTYDGMYHGSIAGTKTVPNLGSSSVNAALVLVVANDTLVSSSFDGQAFPEQVPITDSIPGISQMVSWQVATGGANDCSFHMTGTFRTGTALGNTASGTFSYDAASGCSSGGTWQTNTQ